MWASLRYQATAVGMEQAEIWLALRDVGTSTRNEQMFSNAIDARTTATGRHTHALAEGG